jgi:hypothetical protein
LEISYSTLGGEEIPPPRQTLEFSRRLAEKVDACASDEIRHDPRHENLAGTSFVHNTCGDTNGDTCNIFTAYFNFAGVQPGSQLKPDMSGGTGKRCSALDGAPWPVEARKDAIARCLDQAAAVLVDQTVSQLVVIVKQTTPGYVAQAHKLLCRFDDIGEKYSGENTVSVLCDDVAAGEEFFDHTEGDSGDIIHKAVNVGGRNDSIGFILQDRPELPKAGVIVFLHWHFVLQALVLPRGIRGSNSYFYARRTNWLRIGDQRISTNLKEFRYQLRAGLVDPDVHFDTRRRGDRIAETCPFMAPCGSRGCSPI